MNRLTKLGEVFNRVEEMSQNYHDDFIPRTDIYFNDLGSLLIAGEEHQIKPIAQRLMCNRLNIPHQYLSKCPSELQQENLNYWIEKERNDELFFRFDGDSVRAIFTKRYKKVDNIEVIERLSSLGYDPSTEVQCSLDSTFMNLSIPDSNKTFVVNGDRISPGISIANSEVGLSSLRVEAFFLRLICTNGLISRTNVCSSYRHVSSGILDNLPDVISNVSMELIQIKDKFKYSLESHVDNPENTLQSFNRQFQLDKVQQEAVTWAWPQEQGNNMFSIIQTYTRASQKTELSAESRYRLQSVGGHILSMVKTSQVPSTIGQTPSTIGTEV